MSSPSDSDGFPGGPMATRSTSPSIPLPKGWTKVVNAAVLHAPSLAATAENQRHLPIVELKAAA